MRRTKKERLEMMETVAGLDLLADEKEAAAKTRGELSRLSAFMKRGGQLVAENVGGAVGLVYRSRDCTTAPFGPDTVAKWCLRERKPLPDFAPAATAPRASQYTSAQA